MDTVSVSKEDEQTAAWPSLPFEQWQETCETLHLWTQVVGKVRLALSPSLNHWWQVPLYMTARGLTTSPIPYKDGIFEVNFDFIEHNLYVLTSHGQTKVMPLVSRSVADFYREFMLILGSLSIEVKINTLPSEIPQAIRCDVDEVHASYDPVYANRFWRVLMQSDRVFKEFRGRFTGKSSPVHFFWGSFDLAVTRFSGREAPPRDGADAMTQEAYSHEEMSWGFWPGNASSPTPVYYAYAAPEPPGLKTASVQPQATFYSQQMGEFFLPYDAVRQADQPGQLLLDFMQSTYDAGANLGQWDRAGLDRKA